MSTSPELQKTRPEIAARVNVPLSASDLAAFLAICAKAGRSEDDVLSSEIQALWSEAGGDISRASLPGVVVDGTETTRPIKLTVGARVTLEHMKSVSGLQLQQLTPRLVRRVIARGAAVPFDVRAQARMERAARARHFEKTGQSLRVKGGQDVPRASANISQTKAARRSVRVTVPRGTESRILGKARANDPHTKPTIALAARQIILHEMATLAAAEGAAIAGPPVTVPRGPSTSMEVAFVGESATALATFEQRNPSVDLSLTCAEGLIRFADSDLEFSDLMESAFAYAVICATELEPVAAPAAAPSTTPISLTALLLKVAETARAEKMALSDYTVRMRFEGERTTHAEAYADALRSMVENEGADRRTGLRLAHAVNDAERNLQTVKTRLETMASLETLLDRYQQSSGDLSRAKGEVDLSVQIRIAERFGQGDDPTEARDNVLKGLYEQEWGPWDDRYSPRSPEDAAAHHMVRSFVEQSLGAKEFDFAVVAERPVLQIEAGRLD